ncbi:hypothetical protein AOL_s00091g32 [Orbilia oligospora ATCC 24927]|uniref:Uncharacterized protein n=1 Tax=Arthrobotrys oligospora (strain ATCC 24927 / CBS 115.81 / DSM 1491) TaxID=756982 RepID=G1XHY0_ARTOA|nr:hypothetical protein AOL_s00091g32 [Orbilia oligospora ATCC 24927]EGX47211.1 hypothetical protein AOL_s00091g32 [Orbilia oligospora ATCC 24927]
MRVENQPRQYINLMKLIDAILIWRGLLTENQKLRNRNAELKRKIELLTARVMQIDTTVAPLDNAEYDSDCSTEVLSSGYPDTGIHIKCFIHVFR